MCRETELAALTTDGISVVRELASRIEHAGLMSFIRAVACLGLSVDNEE